MTESPIEATPSVALFARELEQAKQLGLLSDPAIQAGLSLNLTLLEEHFERVCSALNYQDDPRE